MNIFSNLKTPEQIQKERDLDIAKHKGLALEEYYALRKKKWEEECRKSHEEYLRNKGITEKEYQRQEHRKQILQKVKNISRYLLYFITFSIVAATIWLAYNYHLLKPIAMILGGIWIAYLILLYICTPIFLVIYSLISRNKKYKVIKILVASILTIIAIITLACLIGPVGTTHSYIKLRPDKF